MASEVFLSPLLPTLNPKLNPDQEYMTPKPDTLNPKLNPNQEYMTKMHSPPSQSVDQGSDAAPPPVLSGELNPKP